MLGADARTHTSPPSPALISLSRRKSWFCLSVSPSHLNTVKPERTSNPGHRLTAVTLCTMVRHSAWTVPLPPPLCPDHHPSTPSPNQPSEPAPLSLSWFRNSGPDGASVTLCSMLYYSVRGLAGPRQRYPKAKIQIFTFFDKCRYQRYLSLSCVCACVSLAPVRPAACVLRDKPSTGFSPSLSNSKA